MLKRTDHEIAERPVSRRAAATLGTNVVDAQRMTAACAQAVHKQSADAAAVLCALAARRAPLLEALEALARLHSPPRGLPWRRCFAAAGDRVFVHPDDVDLLIAAGLERAATLFASATSVRHDLLAAAFIVWLITAVHPLENGNGRVGVDLAQYALMLRWQAATPPLALPRQAHRSIGRVLAAADAPWDGRTREGLYRYRTEVASRIAGASLPGLAAAPSFSAAAEWLAIARPTLPQHRSHP